MKKISLIVYILLMSMFIGCSSSNNKVKTPQYELMKDKNKAYVVFMREHTFLGAAHYPRIIKYDPIKDEINFVGELGLGDKIIYPINEGEHLFYTNYLFNTITKINAEKGKVYYLDINRLNFNPIVPDKSKLSIKKLLKESTCDEQILNKFLFKDTTPIEEHNTLNTIKSTNLTFESPLLIKIFCKDNIIFKVEDFYNFISIDELEKNTKLVTPSENAISTYKTNSKNYKKEIKTYYEQWKEKLEDIPYTDFWTVLKINYNVTSEYYKKFSNINIQEKNDSIKNKEIIKDFNRELLEKLKSSIVEDTKETLYLKYSIKKHINGSQMGRYFQLSPSSIDSMASIHVSVDFYNSKEMLIGSIEVSDLLTGGILGGFNKLESNVINLIKDYTERNFIQ